MNTSIADDYGLRQPVFTVELPPFMVREGMQIDGWRPGTGSGNALTDAVVGEIYADQAILYARQIKDPKVISFIVATIYAKALRREITMGAHEQGFFDLLARLAYAGSLN